MAQTVIGIFKNSTEAQNAREHLLKNGFSHNNVDVASRSESTYSDENRSDKDQDFGDRISNFFSNLFSDEDEVSRYSKAAAHGTVVTVHAQTKEEAEAAADILDDYGAMDVDEYAAEDRPDVTGSTATGYGASEINRTGSSDSTFDSGRVSPVGTSADSDFSDTDSDLSRNTGTYAGTDADITSRNMDTDRMTGADRTESPGIYTGRDSAYTNPDMDTDRRNRMDAKSDSDITNRNLDSDRIGDRDNTRIPIIEEKLNVGKKEVQTGGKRLHSRIVERPVEEAIRLREEHVRVERNPADRAASEEDITNFKEGTVEITEKKEVPVVNKEARVVEDVNIYKDVDEKQEVVKETLRTTRVDEDEMTASNKDRDENDDADRNVHHDDEHIKGNRPGIV